MKNAEKEALRWAMQAADDARFVFWVQKEGTFFDKGCFVAQQAGEKALKACLYATGKRHVFGHSLAEMVKELSGIGEAFAQIERPAKRLDRFYIATRYPNGLPGGAPFESYTAEDLADAVRDLEQVLETCRSFLGAHGVAFGPPE